MTERATAPIAGKEAILARRYVAALYSLAEQEDLVDVVATDLRYLRRIWDESAEWRFAACDPRLSDDMVASAVDQVAHIADLDGLTAHFLSVVAQHRRLAFLPVLIEVFLAEVATRRGEFRAEIRTAHPLTQAQRDALTASLNLVTGGKTLLTVTEDSSLIGGLTVKLGSKLIDASVKNRLNHLERNLKAGAVA